MYKKIAPLLLLLVICNLGFSQNTTLSNDEKRELRRFRTSSPSEQDYLLVNSLIIEALTALTDTVFCVLMNDGKLDSIMVANQIHLKDTVSGFLVDSMKCRLVLKSGKFFNIQQHGSNTGFYDDDFEMYSYRKFLSLAVAHNGMPYSSMEELVLSFCIVQNGSKRKIVSTFKTNDVSFYRESISVDGIVCE